MVFGVQKLVFAIFVVSNDLTPQQLISWVSSPVLLALFICQVRRAPNLRDFLPPGFDEVFDLDRHTVSICFTPVDSTRQSERRAINVFGNNPILDLTD